LIFKINIKIIKQHTAILNGSIISERGSIKSLKKLKIKELIDLVALNIEISKKLKDKTVNKKEAKNNFIDKILFIIFST
tara:strand:+ start:1089 stop:1325 length:237 start_codon:yes stop_codon:yes gene_type:complete